METVVRTLKEETEWLEKKEKAKSYSLEYYMIEYPAEYAIRIRGLDKVEVDLEKKEIALWYSYRVEEEEEEKTVNTAMYVSLNDIHRFETKGRISFDKKFMIIDTSEIILFFRK